MTNVVSSQPNGNRAFGWRLRAGLWLKKKKKKRPREKESVTHLFPLLFTLVFISDLFLLHSEKGNNDSNERARRGSGVDDVLYAPS